MSNDSSGVVVEDLVVRYGDVIAVDEASFHAPEGRVTVVLGPNGAGKTSTIEVCEGFRRPATGRVRVAGLDPRADHRALTQVMGVMLQGGGVYPSAKVADTIQHYCGLYGAGVEPDALVDLVGLGHRRTTSWRKLSGGEQQRLSLALALAARPRVAFLDEPTSGIDPDGRDTVRRIVRGLADGGATVVMTTHELDEAERVADNVVLFHHGRVLASGALETLRDGRDEIAFTVSGPLDATSLSAVVGAPVEAAGAGRWVVRGTRDPGMISVISAWLADTGHTISELRAGREPLADLYRRLTDGAGAP